MGNRLSFSQHQRSYKSTMYKIFIPAEYELHESRDWIFLVNYFISTVKYGSWYIVVIQYTFVE